MNYRQVFNLNAQLFNAQDPTECFRQWVVLIGSAIVIPFMVLAILRINKFSRVFTIDQLILVLEVAKLSLFVTVTFFAFTLSGYLLCLAMQAQVRVIVGGAFLAKILMIKGQNQYAKLANIIFTSILTVFILLNVVLSFCQTRVGARCNNKASTWHFTSIVVLDVLQTVLIAVLGLILWNHAKPQQSDDFYKQEHKRLIKQISIVGVFFLLSTVCDFVYLTLGQKELANGNILCVKNKFVIVASGEGSAVILLYTVITFAYAAVMLFVFYYLPKKDGLVLDLPNDHFDMTRQTQESMYANEKRAKEFIRAMEGDRNLMNNQLGVSDRMMDEQWLRQSIQNEDPILLPVSPSKVKRPIAKAKAVTDSQKDVNFDYSE